MSWRRTAACALLALALALAATLWINRDIPAARLEEKYATPGSQFLHLDGLRIHYRDEGTGPTVVLLHGHGGDLFDWDPWVTALMDHYRVVRFDFPACGLTGPDPKGDYSGRHMLDLAERIIDALALKHFVLGGTSLGADIATQYASRHPERVERLILLNPDFPDGDRVLRSTFSASPLIANVRLHLMPRAMAEQLLRSHAGDPGHITEAQIERTAELWRREGNRPALIEASRSYDNSDARKAFAELRSAVLLLQGEASPIAPGETAGSLLDRLKNTTDKRLIVYPRTGWPALAEAGAATARDVRAWLDGTLPATS